MYGVKALIEFERFKNDLGEIVFEERVLALQGVSPLEALVNAAEEAREYADRQHGKFLYTVSAWRMTGGEPEVGSEIYSCLRASNLEADAFLDFHFDNGDECVTKF